MVPNLFCSRTITPNIQAKVNKNYLQHKEKQEVLEVMASPHTNPDLNIIECVWDIMNLNLRKPKATKDLWLVLQDVWNNLPSAFLQNELMLPGKQRVIRSNIGLILIALCSFKAFCSLIKINY